MVYDNLTTNLQTQDQFVEVSILYQLKQRYESDFLFELDNQQSSFQNLDAYLWKLWHIHIQEINQIP